MNKRIRIARGNSNTIANSNEIPAIGQPVYDTTNKYLYIGKDDVNTLSSYSAKNDAVRAYVADSVKPFNLIISDTVESGEAHTTIKYNVDWDSNTTLYLPTTIQASIIGNSTSSNKVNNTLTFNSSVNEGVVKTDTFDGSSNKSLSDKVLDLFSNQEINGIKTFNNLKSASFLPKETTSNIGASNNKFNDIYANTIYAHNYYVEDFTYIVDSDQKLLDWANNVSGNNYKKVLIKNGTWTCSKSINLSSTNTKLVVGERNAKIIFNVSTAYGFSRGQYGVPQNEFDIISLYVELNTTSPSRSGCFKNLCLLECSGETNKDAVFLECRYVERCSVSINSNHSTTTGYYHCTNVTNCKDMFRGSSSTTDKYMYNGCTNMIGCVCDISGDIYKGSIFHICKNLTNCGTSTTTSYGNILGDFYVFNNCENLSNCNAIIKTPTNTTYATAGYKDCRFLTNCYGFITNWVESDSTFTNKYVYDSCKGMLMCSGYANYNDKIYTNCYASGNGTSSSVVGDSANGGYNYMYSI